MRENRTITSDPDFAYYFFLLNCKQGDCVSSSELLQQKLVGYLLSVLACQTLITSPFTVKSDSTEKSYFLTLSVSQLHCLFPEGFVAELIRLYTSGSQFHCLQKRVGYRYFLSVLAFQTLTLPPVRKMNDHEPLQLSVCFSPTPEQILPSLISRGK